MREIEYKIQMRSTETPRRHPAQFAFVNSKAKRKIVRAGRRGGKTMGTAIIALQAFLAGRRVLYATPTQEQVDAFWNECTRALAEPLDAGIFYKNETRHIIELPGTDQRIRAKTAWNADSLRGDYADLLILDEYQLMSKDAWDLVGAPMLLDNDGDAVFVYTTVRGKHHSKELFERAKEDTTGRWQTFVFSSFDNPYVSPAALQEITGDMSAMSYRMEILAEEIGDDPRALWRRSDIDESRVSQMPQLSRVVVGVDPPGTAEGAECGIVVAGVAQGHGYILDDRSRRGSPLEWASEAVAAYSRSQADRIVAEVNNGGDMVEYTIHTVDSRVPCKQVRASRGKAIRADPVVALYEKGFVHHLGHFDDLEDQLCSWVPGEGESPDRLDALVWALTELMLEEEKGPPGVLRYA